MRLLNTRTLTFKEVLEPGKVKYSILSHCWSYDETALEVSHQEFLSDDLDRIRAGFQKIERCCKLSLERGFDWTWIDTCCVDKTSSAELTETINSMFNWYRDSSECYVFLDDFRGQALPRIAEFDDGERWKQGLSNSAIMDLYAFIDSRWFKRGWTLQELLAPKKVLFYSKHNDCLGTKVELAPIIAHASGIGVSFLLGEAAINDASVAQRMSWASMRTTTRPEDQAYSLLGTFDINLPLLYGEGTKAFFRLQEEIIRTSDDQSIMAWGIDSKQDDLSGVLADSPALFRTSGNVKKDVNAHSPLGRSIASYAMTNRGLEIHPSDSHVDDWIRVIGASILTCYKLSLRCYQQRSDGSSALLLELRYNVGGKWYRRSLETRYNDISPRQLAKRESRAPLHTPTSSPGDRGRILYVAAWSSTREDCIALSSTQRKFAYLKTLWEVLLTLPLGTVGLMYVFMGMTQSRSAAWGAVFGTGLIILARAIRDPLMGLVFGVILGTGIVIELASSPRLLTKQGHGRDSRMPSRY